jgi:hypothetical protein
LEATSPAKHERSPWTASPAVRWELTKALAFCSFANCLDSRLHFSLGNMPNRFVRDNPCLARAQSTAYVNQLTRANQFLICRLAALPSLSSARAASPAAVKAIWLARPRLAHSLSLSAINFRASGVSFFKFFAALLKRYSHERRVFGSNSSILVTWVCRNNRRPSNGSGNGQCRVCGNNRESPHGAREVLISTGFSGIF